MSRDVKKPKVLIFIISYHAEKFIEDVLQRIPEQLFFSSEYDIEILLIDDCSSDKTFFIANNYSECHPHIKMRVLYNPHNQGYGGNQKIGYFYAVNNKFDAVVLLHGDGQYPPEFLEEMISPIIHDGYDAVFASRMLEKFNALKGKMPFYKWIGNQILTFTQNRILGSHLSEFHTGYRSYRVSTLASLPFMYNSDYFDFDTDIIIQLLDNHAKVKEISIPTFYGEEKSRVNGFKYGYLIIKASIQSRIMRFGIFYNPKFDYQLSNYYPTEKLGFLSSHQFAIDNIPDDSTVVDVGSGSPAITKMLYSKNVFVVSIDKKLSDETKEFSKKYFEEDVEKFNFSNIPTKTNIVLLLDIIEHLVNPEMFLLKLREIFCSEKPDFIITTANIGFFIIRLGLIFGQFNYGRHGILDFEHKHLYTFSSFKRLLTNCGYEIIGEKGIPAPYPLAFGNNWFSKLLLKLNILAIMVARNLFSYQIAIIAKPKSTLSNLMEAAETAREEKLGKINNQI